MYEFLKSINQPSQVSSGVYLFAVKLIDLHMDLFHYGYVPGSDTVIMFIIPNKRILP